MNDLKFFTRDEEVLSLQLEAAKKFRTLKSMIESVSDQSDVERRLELAFESQELVKAFDWARDFNDQWSEEDWKHYFISLSPREVHQIGIVADFLDAPVLLEKSCEMIAETIRKAESSEDLPDIFARFSPL